MEDAANSSMEVCYSALHIDPIDASAIGEFLVNDNYTSTERTDPETLLSYINQTVNLTKAFSFPEVTLDVTDERAETIHTCDSIAILLILLLLFLTIMTVWAFKAFRFRVFHETGLALLYGVVIGVVLRFGLSSSFLCTDSSVEFIFSKPVRNVAEDVAECAEGHVLEINEIIQISSYNARTGDGDSFFCTVDGKAFRDQEGNYIRETLLFDPELFFFALLPPIIFYAGYSLKKRHFFRNLGSLLLYAFAGTLISCVIIGLLMYGYSISGAETVDSWFANATGHPIPDGFTKSAIPSLLFGSLISATDPVTVLAIFHDLHVDHDIFSLVFGESVMNDAVALVLFRSVDVYTVPGFKFTVPSLLISIASFCGIFLGSFLLGCAMGLLTALLMKFSKLRDYPLMETSMFVLMSYSTFILAELAQLTGIVAVLFCGIMQSYYTYINLSLESRRRTKEAFELINFLAENFVFSYMGLSLFIYGNHQWVPGFILFSFVAILAGRLVNIYVLSFILNLGRSKKISFRFQHMLVFAGLRGAIAFALAIRNTQTPERQLIFTTTLCIVIATVLVCGSLTTLALQCLKIQVGVGDDIGGIHEDGQVIPYDKRKGNWLISKFTKFDKDFLIPIFTHHGRPVTDLSRCCPGFCLPMCSKCKPREQLLSEEESDEEERESLEFSSEEEFDEEDQVISFRDREPELDEEMGDTDEGDLGLGSDREGKGNYLHLTNVLSDESSL